MRRLRHRIARAALLLVWIPGVHTAAPCEMPASDATKTPTSVLQTALEHAQAADPTRHSHLLGQLSSLSFLAELDDKAAYAKASGSRLHVDQVVRALAGNSAPSAQAALLKLATNRVFLSHDERVVSLLLASVHVRPAPPDLVRFWNRYSRPNDGFTPTTITVLIENGSAPALVLLEKKLLDPSHSDADKLAWMRSPMLTHRNDLGLLQTCERLLQGKLPLRLRPLLIEALYDYLPQQWCRPTKCASPPRLETASSEALVQLRRIAEFARTSVKLTAEQKAAVTRRLDEIDELLQGGSR